MYPYNLTLSELYNSDELLQCPICNILPEHKAYTYYYGELNKIAGEHETMRIYVCPKCGYGKNEDTRGANFIMEELPYIECGDTMIKNANRMLWNRLVNDKNQVFRHLVKIGVKHD